MLCVQAQYAKVTDKASIQMQNLNNYIHDIITKIDIQNMVNTYRKKDRRNIFCGPKTTLTQLRLNYEIFMYEKCVRNGKKWFF
jgi:hypothetical protein